MASKRNTQAKTPLEFNDLGLGDIKDNAAGIPAVLASVKYVSNEVGFLDGMSLMLKANQTKGFDCPSCAWPDPHPDERSSIAEYCENGAKAIGDEATKKRVDTTFFKKYSVQELSAQSDYWLNKQGRLTSPMFLAKNSQHYEPITWEKAFKHIAKHLNALQSPHEALFYTSGRASNEAAFAYQLFVRQFGTNNMPDCSNMCHESSGVALNETVGIGKGSVTLEDFYEAEVVLVIGQNPGTNHPRMMSALQKCKENGGVIVSINPLPETGLKKFTNPQEVFQVLKGGTSLAEHFLQVKINGDVALLKGIMYLLWQKEQKQGGVFDRPFIEKHTSGYEVFVEDLGKTNLAECEQESGIALAQMQTIANLLSNKTKIIACWAMGLTQHKNAVNNIREVVNLLLLKGSIGHKGAGLCPVRGHSNVQGDRTMGINEKPSEEFLNSLKAYFNFEPPREHGYDTVAAIQAMEAGKAKVFIALGGNFLSATPDTEFTANALQKCALTVQISTKLNRSHLITGEEALILPCLGRTERDMQQSGEQFVSVENSMGIVHSSRGVLEPASDDLMSETAIVCSMAKATLGTKSQVSWQSMMNNYDFIRNQIEACIPGFENYNHRVREDGGFYLPNGARVKNFKTKEGRAVFTINPLPRVRVAEGHFLMMTIRTHDQFNTTVYGLDDRYRGIYNERRVVLMNPDDMAAKGLKAKSMVDLTSHFEGEERYAPSFLVVPFSIPRGCVATYFPEANVLVPIRHQAERSHTPVSKSIEVSIKASKYSPL
ncbi:MAG: hypothetical protein EAZ57_07045 [Cytophagales bacterium]|nr:MAG: hypothetical protein EAZ67_07855 [Cytophagales bacterium]TAF60458.1 MAG: hypothetical protein EAZ57_07045 [Cytophagales bacterium]